tara:strand:+ start:68 stop:679 length:612 start_codon:yes stop_codon:yes gene_type:complete
MGKRNEQQKEIKNFIEKSLVRRLKNDQRELKILSEGDLQSCVYYHLRKKLKKMPNWHLLNKLYMGEKEEEKKVPDIAIAYLNYDGETVYPKFLIELKETIGPLSGNSKKGYKKDIQKLKELIKKHKNKIVKTYFILAVLPIPGRKGTSKSPIMHSTKDIEEAIQENKLNSKIQAIVINTQYYRNNLQNPSFMKKVKLLRKFRE